jgi:hypothetical protein
MNYCDNVKNYVVAKVTLALSGFEWVVEAISFAICHATYHH